MSSTLAHIHLHLHHHPLLSRVQGAHEPSTAPLTSPTRPYHRHHHHRFSYADTNMHPRPHPPPLLPTGLVATATATAAQPIRAGHLHVGGGGWNGPSMGTAIGGDHLWFGTTLTDVEHNYETSRNNLHALARVQAAHEQLHPSAPPTYVPHPSASDRPMPANGSLAAGPFVPPLRGANHCFGHGHGHGHTHGHTFLPPPPAPSYRPVPDAQHAHIRPNVPASTSLPPPPPPPPPVAHADLLAAIALSSQAQALAALARLGLGGQGQGSGPGPTAGATSPPVDPTLPKPDGPSANNRKLGLYKTELCRSWNEKRSCRYGNKCQFAHGPSELRAVQRHRKYKTEVCRTFWKLGSCPYASRCVFIHTNIRPPNGFGNDPGDTDPASQQPLIARRSRAAAAALEAAGKLSTGASKSPTLARPAHPPVSSSLASAAPPRDSLASLASCAPSGLPAVSAVSPLPPTWLDRQAGLSQDEYEFLLANDHLSSSISLPPDPRFAGAVAVCPDLLAQSAAASHLGLSPWTSAAAWTDLHCAEWATFPPEMMTNHNVASGHPSLSSGSASTSTGSVTTTSPPSSVPPTSPGQPPIRPFGPE